MIEKLTLFFLKANQYESSVLRNTNCIREHQQQTFVTLNRGLSDYVTKGKLVLGNTNKKLLSHLVLAIGGAGFELIY